MFSSRNIPYSHQRGFTLVEILVAIAIVLIILGISIRTFSNVESTEALQRDASAVASLLETARVHSISSLENDQYGIYISGSDIMLFQGDSYTPAGELAKESLHASVSFQTISITGSPDTIVFKKITGATDNDGTLTLSSQDMNAASTITIDKTGNITTRH